MRISDWSSDVCSSDLPADVDRAVEAADTAYRRNRDLSAAAREGWMIKASALMERDASQFADTLVDEIGSPIAKAGFETRFDTSFFLAAAGVPRRIRGATRSEERRVWKECVNTFSSRWSP